jgi:hypothetical protein
MLIRKCSTGGLPYVVYRNSRIQFLFEYRLHHVLTRAHSTSEVCTILNCYMVFHHTKSLHRLRVESLFTVHTYSGVLIRVDNPVESQSLPARQPTFLCCCIVAFYRNAHSEYQEPVIVLYLYFYTLQNATIGTVSVRATVDNSSSLETQADHLLGRLSC